MAVNPRESKLYYQIRHCRTIIRSASVDIWWSAGLCVPLGLRLVAENIRPLVAVLLSRRGGGLRCYQRPLGDAPSTAERRFAVAGSRVAFHALICSGATRAKNARRLR
jgi:hypothetical protein